MIYILNMVERYDHIRMTEQLLNGNLGFGKERVENILFSFSFGPKGGIPVSYFIAQI